MTMIIRIKHLVDIDFRYSRIVVFQMLGVFEVSIYANTYDRPCYEHQVYMHTE